MTELHYEGPPRPFDDELAKQFKDYAEIVAQYPVNLELEGFAGAQKADVAQLRPEPFLCRRITWATTADTLRFTGVPQTLLSSWHGQAVAVRFGDSFTTFLGKTAGLVTAVFGDSNGYLDLSRGILFQGSQPVKIELERLFWPAATIDVPEATTRWDFIFHGVGLLPAAVGASGAA